MRIFQTAVEASQYEEIEELKVEIDRLTKQLSTERSILYNAPVWEEMVKCPPDTVISVRYEQLIKWHDDIARLQAQVATYERIITSNIEDSKRIGDSAKPYMNEVKSWQTIENEAAKAAKRQPRQVNRD